MTSHLGNITDDENLTKPWPDAGSHQQTFTDSEFITINFFFAFFASVGLLENIVVVAIILHHKIMLEIPSTWFVLSLAIADGFFCFTGIPAMYALCTGASYIFVGVVVEFITITSAGNLLILTFNRFLSVHNSLRYPALMTCTRAKYLVIIPWVVAFLLAVIVAILCRAGIHNSLYLLSAYYTTLIILTSALNIYMFKQARNKRRVTAQQESVFLATRDRLFKREFRLLVRLLLVTLTFFGACIPTVILLYLYPTIALRQTSSFQRKIVACYLVSLFNAATNPLIYSTNHPIFQRYFNNARNRIFPRDSVGALATQLPEISVISNTRLGDKTYLETDL